MRIDILEENQKQLIGRVDQLQTTVEILSSDLEIVKVDVAVLKEDVAVLKEDVAVLKTDMVEVKQTLNSHGEILSFMVEKLDQTHRYFDVMLEQHRDECSRIMEVFESNRDRLNNHEDRIGRLEAS